MSHKHKDEIIRYANAEEEKVDKRYLLIPCEKCNVERKIRKDHHKNNKAKICRNCYEVDKDSNSRLYFIYNGMKQRCFNKNNPKYERYGNRNITVCDEWNESYLNFKKWAMSNGYGDKLTIDRKNNDGNYEPSNCRWATGSTQQNNRKDSALNKIGIDVMSDMCEAKSSMKITAIEIAEYYDMSKSTISRILNGKFSTCNKEAV